MQPLIIEYQGNPIPASRPRFGQGRAYIKKDYREWKDGLIFQICSLTRHMCPYFAKSDNLHLNVHFYRKNMIRYDLDNAIKGVMDALTQAGIYYDDSQITSLTATKGISKDNPHTRIEIRKV